jgi:hypothetical protein
MVGGLLAAVWPLVGRDGEGIELVNLCLRNCPLILEVSRQTIVRF